jgi:hypothetical protein
VGPYRFIQRAPSAAAQKRGGNGAQKAIRQPGAENPKFNPVPVLELNREESAALVKRLLGDVQGLKPPDAALEWACQAIGAKNSLTSADARVLDDAFRAKLADLEVLSPEDIGASSRMAETQRAAPGSSIAEASNSSTRAHFHSRSRGAFGIAITSNTSPGVHA